MLFVPSIRSCAIATILLAGTVTSPLAYAHAGLVSATPKADATVSAPTQIELVFNEKLMPRVSRLNLSQVKDGAPAALVGVDSMELSADGKTLRAKLHHPLEAGPYRVQWRAVGPDNHPMTGEYRFTVN